MLAAFERGVEVVEHVVEGDHAPLALAPAQVGADGVDQVADQAQAGELELAGDGAAGGEQGVGGVEERVGRRRLILVGARFSAGARQQVAASRPRRSARAARPSPEPGVPCGRGAVDRLVLVRALVERRQRCLDRARRSPSRCAAQSLRCRFVRRGQRRRVDRRRRRIEARRPQILRQRLGEAAPQQLRVLLGRVFPLQQVGGERRRAAVAGDAAAPEIVDGLHRHLAVVGDELEREGQAGGKRRVGERALAEAVDGEDRGFVEVLQRLVELQRELRAVEAGALLDRLHEVRDERVAGRRGPRRRRAARPASRRSATGCARAAPRWPRW